MYSRTGQMPNIQYRAYFGTQYLKWSYLYLFDICWKMIQPQLFALHRSFAAKRQQAGLWNNNFVRTVSTQFRLQCGLRWRRARERSHCCAIDKSPGHCDQLNRTFFAHNFRHMVCTLCTYVSACACARVCVCTHVFSAKDTRLAPAAICSLEKLPANNRLRALCTQLALFACAHTLGFEHARRQAHTLTNNARPTARPPSFRPSVLLHCCCAQCEIKCTESRSNSVCVCDGSTDTRTNAYNSSGISRTCEREIPWLPGCWCVFNCAAAKWTERGGSAIKQNKTPANATTAQRRAEKNDAPKERQITCD